MKKIISQIPIIIVLILVLAGVEFFVWQKGRGEQNKPSVVSLEYPTFGIPQKLHINESVRYVDGATVLLKDINDSRCPDSKAIEDPRQSRDKEGVVCVFAGELSPRFVIYEGIASKETEFIMGATIKTNATVEGYKFELKEVTETSATIIVTKESQATGPCYVGGCSSHICSDQKDVVSTCEYRQEYACYKTAACERQANGQCGWTQTSELMTCLNR